MGVVGQSLPDLGVALVAIVPIGELEGSGRQLRRAERVKGQVLILQRKASFAHIPTVWSGRHRDLAGDLGTHGIG